jgi:hypothetical protein
MVWRHRLCSAPALLQDLTIVCRPVPEALVSSVGCIKVSWHVDKPIRCGKLATGMLFGLAVWFGKQCCHV